MASLAGRLQRLLACHLAQRGVLASLQGSSASTLADAVHTRLV